MTRHIQYVIHATGMTLAAVTTGATRDRVLDRITAATETLEERTPTPLIPTTDKLPAKGTP